MDHPHLISGFAQFLPRANRHLLKPENAISSSSKPDNTAPAEVPILQTAKNITKITLSKAVQTTGTSSSSQTVHNLNHNAKFTDPKDRSQLLPSKSGELPGSSQWERSLDSLGFGSPVVGEIPNVFEEAMEPTPRTASQDVPQATSSHTVGVFFYILIMHVHNYNNLELKKKCCSKEKKDGIQGFVWGP